MSHKTHDQLLLSRGRKAGLTTRELYSALNGRPPEDSDALLGQVDCNGFVSSINGQGQRIYNSVGCFTAASH